MASAVDLLFFTLLAMSSAVVIVIGGLIIYFGVKYRRTPENQLADQLAGSTRLEIAWTVIPLIIFLGIFGWGARLYFDMVQPPAQANDVYVVAKQWMWELQHAEGKREINTLHVPLGEPIRLTMVSQDVIHSFYVPAFRIKQDVLPERYTTTWFQATTPGTYRLFCAEYCGTLHSGMLGEVIVMEPDAYRSWLGVNGGEAPAAAGEHLFTQFGCIGCHKPDNTGPGPSLIGVFGSTVTFNDGTTALADENYIRESILNPDAQIVKGHEAIMPSFRGQLSEEQLLALLAYIKSLGSGGTGATPTGTPTPTNQP